MFIEDIERDIEQMYRRYSLKPEIREILGAVAFEDVEKSQKQFEMEQTNLNREKDKLERKRKKLLEAHYNDAIPLDLLLNFRT